MLEAVSSFHTALQGLFIAQREAVQAATPGCGPHLCLMGGGREHEDQLLHMVAAAMLQQHTAYVSLAKAGYRGKAAILQQHTAYVSLAMAGYRGEAAMLEKHTAYVSLSKAGYRGEAAMHLG